MQLGLQKRLIDGARKINRLFCRFDGHQSQTTNTSLEKASGKNVLMEADAVCRDASGNSFMIAEFQSLYEQRNHLNTTTSSEIQMFLFIISALILSVSFVRESALVSQQSFFVVCSTATTLATILGISTFYRTVNSRIQIFTYARAMNRIRKYYVELCPHIESYLLMPTSHKIPNFASIGQNQRYTSQILNNTGVLALVTSSLFCGAFLSYIALLAEIDIIPSLPVWLISLACVMALFGSFLILLRWQHLILDLAEVKFHSRYSTIPD